MTWEIIHRAEDRVAAANLADYPTALPAFGPEPIRERLRPPREIAFDQNLPHTRSGKVMRRLLKARELGLPEGDTSTLERGSSDGSDQR